MCNVAVIQEKIFQNWSFYRNSFLVSSRWADSTSYCFYRHHCIPAIGSRCFLNSISGRKWESIVSISAIIASIYYAWFQSDRTSLLKNGRYKSISFELLKYKDMFGCFMLFNSLLHTHSFLKIIFRCAALKCVWNARRVRKVIHKYN